MYILKHVFFHVKQRFGGGCHSNMRFILQADCIAKGLLALGLVPGEDVVVAVGVPANSSCALFVAGCSVGIGFAVSISRIESLMSRDKTTQSHITHKLFYVKIPIPNAHVNDLCISGFIYIFSIHTYLPQRILV